MYIYKLVVVIILLNYSDLYKICYIRPLQSGGAIFPLLSLIIIVIICKCL